MVYSQQRLRPAHPSLQSDQSFYCLHITVNPLYNSTHYSSKILYNVILIFHRMATLFKIFFFITLQQSQFNIKILGMNAVILKRVHYIKDINLRWHVNNVIWHMTNRPKHIFTDNCLLKISTKSLMFITY